MKLNTLLLTSAATLMATSVAFAADLPSKKAAPSAGAVQVCKVGGMTGFTLPGSDTCLQISGRVTVDFVNSDMDDEYFDNYEDGNPFGDGVVGYRVNLDARSNSDLGVVRTFISLTGGNGNGSDSSGGATTDTYARKAFIQVGGFTAGLKDSLADIAGTQGNMFDSLMDQTGYGVDYQMAIGTGMTLGIGIEQNSDHDESPAMLARVTGSAGGVNYKLVGVMVNDSNGDSTSAILGHVDVKMGAATFYAFAGYGDATDYVNGSSHNSDEYGSVYGGGITFAASNALSVTLEGRIADDDGWNEQATSIGLFASYTAAKNLYIQPEVVMSQNSSGTETTAAMLRIQRDF